MCRECVIVALGIQYAMRMRMCRTAICGPYHIFPHYLINGTVFDKNAIEHKMLILILFTFILNISYFKKNSARYHHKCKYM
jgi:hypothetical protein